MPEEIIYCPSCNRKLRVPEAMLGDIVQCPLCGHVFTAPTRGGPAPPPPPPPPPPLREDAETGPPAVRAQHEEGPLGRDLHDRVRAAIVLPAIGLLVAGTLGTLVNVMQIVMALTMPEMMEGMKVFGLEPPSPQASMASGAIFALVSLVVLIAGMQMAAMRMYGLALAGSVLALVNVGNCCCLLGLPVGIWSLAILCRPEVRDAFD